METPDKVRVGGEIEILDRPRPVRKFEKPLFSLGRPRSEELEEVVGAFESETTALMARTRPRSPRIVLYVVAGLLGAALLAGALVKLDRYVTGTGVILPMSGAVFVSPFDNGQVRDILVKVGDRVKKGQVLATLDPTFTQADVTQLREHRDSDLAAIARLEAELAHRPYVYSRSRHYEALNGELYEKLMAQYKADIANFDAQIGSAKALVAQYQSDADKYTVRLKLARDTEDMYRSMVDKGYVSQLQLMQATDQATELARLLADARQQLESNQELLDSVVQQKESYIQKWDSSATTELVGDRNDLDSTIDSLTKAEKSLELVTLTAPVDAYVVKVAKISRGSTVAGQGAQANTVGSDPFFTLMPMGEELVAQVNVQTQDVSFMRNGDQVFLKLDAYTYVYYGIAKGVIKTISEQSFTLDDNLQPTPPYYRVVVKITELDFHDVPKDFRLIPGMTLTADMVVGERTILQYIMESVLRTGSEALREP